MGRRIEVETAGEDGQRFVYYSMEDFRAGIRRGDLGGKFIARIYRGSEEQCVQRWEHVGCANTAERKEAEHEG